MIAALSGQRSALRNQFPFLGSQRRLQGNFAGGWNLAFRAGPGVHAQLAVMTNLLFLALRSWLYDPGCTQPEETFWVIGIGADETNLVGSVTDAAVMDTVPSPAGMLDGAV